MERLISRYRNSKNVQTVWLIMQKLRKADQLEAALSGALEILCASTKSGKGSIWMLDSLSSRLISIMHSGTSNSVGESAAVGEGLIGEVFKTGKPVTYKVGEAKNVRLAGADGPAITDKRVMCVPISTPQHVIGCLLLTCKVEGDYTEDEVKTCENCCAILAIDIEDKGFEFRPFEQREPIVSVRGIIKEFKSGEEMRRILKGVDLDVYPGELMVVLGESGCGKSTLLNIIGGMDRMTDGQLVVDGRDMSKPSEDELTEYRRNYIGFIFQSYNLMPNLSAMENIEFIGEIAKEPMDSMEALRMVGLEDKSGNLPSALSGGQMQRISIARALVKNPKIILADEPTAALDYETSIMVLKVIEQIVKERKTTVLMVTHNPEIAKMANRVIKLRDGKISSIRVNLHPLRAEELVW